MVWKKKEKELTEEEALKLAIKELKPRWLNSDPIIAGIENEEKYTAHPLVPDFAKKNWLIAFMDPTTYAGLNVFQITKDWQQRYGKLNFNIVLVLQTTSKELIEKRPLRNLLESQKIRFIITLDEDLSLYKALHVENTPTCIFISQGKEVLRETGEEIFSNLEKGIQKHFRESDPGIPFSPPLENSEYKRDIKSIHFGSIYKNKLALYTKIPKQLRDSDLDWSKIPSDTFILDGEWQTHQEKIETSDSKAALFFYSPSKGVSIFGKNDPNKVDLAKVYVEINGAPVVDAYAGKDLHMDDEGATHFILKDLKLYEILSDLTDDMREIAFYFSTAKFNTVQLYAFRFFE